MADPTFEIVSGDGYHVTIKATFDKHESKLRIQNHAFKQSGEFVWGSGDAIPDSEWNGNVVTHTFTNRSPEVWPPGTSWSGCKGSLRAEHDGVLFGTTYHYTLP